MTSQAPGIVVMLGALTLGASGREIAWADIAPAIQQLLAARGIDGATLPTRISEIRRRNEVRVREGDLDHLVHYALQSSSFTDLLPIEPALSAQEFTRHGTIPPDARARLDRFLAAVDGSARDARLAYFRDLLVKDTGGISKRDFLDTQYTRAMRFLYEKEFVAAKQPNKTEAVAVLYQTRGLSTDTSVEAGYVVYLGLATLRQLDPQRVIRSVLVVGPGIDLAPRTGFVGGPEPQSVQPFAVLDALLTTGLARRGEIRVTSVDINPRVVEWIDHARGARTHLSLTTSIAETGGVRFTSDFREYFEQVGGGISNPSDFAGGVGGRQLKSMEVEPGVAAALEAARLDVVVDRLDRRFDLIVVTNVLPYLPDIDLLLALTNLTAMLAPGGVLLHNEPRPILAEATAALRLGLLHSRSVVIATVAGADAPLYDSIWMHRAPD
jgi:Nodulation protein S (NodS)